MRGFSDRPLEPGAQVGVYTVDDVASIGADHISYRATHGHSGRPVELKEFKPAGRMLRAPDGVTLLPREPADAGIFAGLIDRIAEQTGGRERFAHPNVIGIYDFVRANGTIYVGMDSYPGRPLASLVDDGESLDPMELDEIAPPILDGLESLHAENLLHFDLTPASVLIRRDARPMLGRAALWPAGPPPDGASILRGAADPYLAEEHYYSDVPMGPWTDIYGLCATLYRLIAGAPPASALRRGRDVARGRPDPLIADMATLAPAWPAGLLEALAAGLALAPADRTASVARFRSAFASFSDDEPITVRSRREPPRDEQPATVRIEPRLRGLSARARRRTVSQPEAVQPTADPGRQIFRKGAPTLAPSSPVQGPTTRFDGDPAPTGLAAFPDGGSAPRSWSSLSMYLFEPGLDSLIQQHHTKTVASLPEARAKSRSIIRRGAPVTLTTSIPGRRANPGKLTMEFWETFHRVDLRVSPQEATGRDGADIGQYSGRTAQFVGPVLTAELAFASDEHRSARSFCRPYLCYAPDDALFEPAIDNAMRWLNMPYVGETQALRQQRDWDRQIFTKIEQADVFLLFWSEAAQTDRIQKEWRFALELGRERFVHIVALEESPADLPPELAVAPIHVFPETVV